MVPHFLQSPLLKIAEHKRLSFQLFVVATKQPASLLNQSSRLRFADLGVLKLIRNR
jgi:hypothetical protein